MSLVFNKKIILFICASIISSTHATSPSGSELTKHIHVLQELKSYFLNKEKKVSFQKVVQTPTLAYIAAVKAGKIDPAFGGFYGNGKHSSYDTINKDWQYYRTIVDTILAREKEYCNSYYVFYHGQKSIFRIFQDLLKEIYTFIHIHSSLNEFEFFRIWHEAEKTFNLQQFIDNEEKKLTNQNSYYQSTYDPYYHPPLPHYPPNWNDTKPDMIKNMLCVNLSLFGNLTHLGESSFSYFKANSNCAAPDIKPLLIKLFNHFGFNINYLDQLLALTTLITTQEGNLLQIFTPKNKVDDYVYVSQDYGTPIRYPIEHTIFDHAKSRHIKISPILDLYTKNPTLIREFDRLQARILLSQDGILNPDSGVKIFRYTTIPETNMVHYKKQLRELVSKMMSQWLETNANHSIASTPLERLMRYASHQSHNK